MTNEEKEVIEETKKKIESTQKGLKEGKYYGEQFNLEREIKREQILLNLINRLQKENVELKENSLYYRQELEKAWKENEKLKDRIEYLGNEKYALYQDNISLLKEKYGIESIYYNYIETPPVEVKGYISEDKIKAKIKELEKDIETHNIYEENWNKIEVLKELLGDE